MNPADLIVENKPSPQDLQFLEDQINAYNMAQTGYYDFQWLTLFVRDEAQRILAGLSGFTWGESCRIQTVWVHEALRGQGYGQALLAKAEDEARARGCHVIVLESHSFQAPAFYQKLGYQVVGVQQDYPVGHSQTFLQKRLVTSGG